MALRPLRDILYIIPLEDNDEVGSIIRPDTAKQKVDQGIVKYRGPLTTGEVKVGDHVFFSGYEGEMKALIEGEGPLITIREDDILFVMDDDTPAKWLIPYERLEKLLDRSLTEHNRRTGVTEDEALMAVAITARLKDHIKTLFLEELHF